MKKVLCAAIAVSAASTFATDLDLKQGQYSFAVQSTDFSFNLAHDSTKNSATDYAYIKKDSAFNLFGRGQYAYTDDLRLGAYLSLGTFNTDENLDSSGTKTTRNSDYGFYSLAPNIEYSLNKNISLYSAVSYSSRSPLKSVNQDGDVSYDSGVDNFSELTFSLGGIYKKDLKPNLMLDLRSTLLHHTRNWVNDIDSSETTRQTELELVGQSILRYFVTDNFSADFSLALGYESLLTSEENGEASDLSKTDAIDTFMSSYFGFTFYFR